MSELFNIMHGLLKDKNTITPDDVLAFRRTVFADQIVSFDEAEAMFAIDASVSKVCREWSDFFCEAIIDLLVNQPQPEGFVTDGHAGWLIDQVMKDGRIQSYTELELITKVVERANRVPVELEAFALKAISVAVIEGEGSLVRLEELTPGVIGKSEVEMLRRVLFALAGSGGMAISKEEAELLFDLNDRTINAENDPSWTDFFVRACANHLMANPAYRRTASGVSTLTEQDYGVGRVLSGMFSGGTNWVDSLIKGLTEMNTSPGEAVMARLNAQKEEMRIVNEAITMDEANWLIDRMNRDGNLHDNEVALLHFLKKESHELAPELQALIAKVA